MDQTRRAPSRAADLAEPLALLRPHWRLVLAAFLGWFLDAFDQVALLLVLPAVGKEFGVSLTLMGLVLAAQSLGRIIGNTGWGWLADMYGRRLAFMAGVVWFAACSGLTGLAWSYAALVVVQFLFGMGFGGEWTASAALLMETVPARSRAVASSLMMAGFEAGFLAASGVNALLVPHYGWRALFFVGIVPALLAIFIRLGVGESPVWLRTQAARREGRAEARSPAQSTGRRFRMDGPAWQACLFMAALQTLTASLYSFYPTLLQTVRHFTPTDVFVAVATYSVGSILGKLAIGRAATRFGHRATILVCLLVTALAIVPFASASSIWFAALTAFVAGAASSGIFALVPHYLSLRFTDAVRSFGMGLAYAVAAFSAAVSAYAVPAAGRGLGLALAIEVFVIASAVAAALIVVREPHPLPGATMDRDEPLAA